MSKRPAGAALAYGVFALVTTWPLARELGTAVPGWLGDQSYNIWAVDTFWTQIAAGRSPFTTARILAPLGANLAEAITAPAIAILAAPFWFWGGDGCLLAFFSVLCLAAIVLAGLGMRAAVLTMTGDARAAFWAGLFYAGSPALLSFVGSPWHFKVAAGAILPWGLAAVLRWYERPTGRRLLGVSAIIWLLLFTDYYAAFMFLVLVVAVVAIGLRRALVPSILVGLGANLCLGLVVILALLPPLDPTDLSIGGGTWWSFANTNLADLFVPGTDLSVAMPGVGPGVLPGAGVRWSGVLGAWSELATDTGPDPGSYFIGYGVLGLIVVALCRRWRLRRLWGVFAGGVLLTLLSGGTALRWGTTVLAEEAQTPFYWLVQIPWLQTFDLPRCFILGATVAFIATAGVGLATLRWRRGWLVGGLALTIFVVDYGRIGIQMATIQVPSVYRDLAGMADDRTLLELPMGLVESKGGLGRGENNSVAMYWQTLHRKPRVACYISRIPHRVFTWFVHAPVLGDLLVMTSLNSSFSGYLGETRVVSRLPDYPPAVVDRFVRQLNLGYVLFQPDPKQAFYMAEVDKLLAERIVERRVVDDYALYVLIGDIDVRHVVAVDVVGDAEHGGAGLGGDRREALAAEREERRLVEHEPPVGKARRHRTCPRDAAPAAEGRGLHVRAVREVPDPVAARGCVTS